MFDEIFQNELFQNEIFQNITIDPVTILDNILYSTPFIILQITSIIITIFFVYVWIKLLRSTGIMKMKFGQLRESIHETAIPKSKIIARWKKIQEKLESSNESDWKLAIIEADAMLDDIVKSLGYRGDTMGERMRQIKPDQFAYLDDAWRAHKVRNFIAHDSDYVVRHETAKRTLDIYRKVFNQFSILD